MDPLTIAMLGSSALSGAGALKGLIGGGPSSNVPAPINPIHQAAQLFPYASQFGLSQVGSAPNIYGSTLGQYGDLVNSIINNPGAGQFRQGAGDAATMGRTAAGNNFDLGNFLAMQGQSLSPYAGSVLNTAFDPQQALFERTRQQLQEQTRAGQGARGLAMSPFGQGLEDKAMRDFNIDWQNNLLGRMVTGAGGATNLLGTGNNLIGSGAGLMASAPNLLMQTQAFPWSANNQIAGAGTQALQGYGQQGFNATQQPQQQLQDFYQLVGLGNAGAGVNNSIFGNQLKQAMDVNQQNQQFGSGLGQSIAGLGKGLNTGWGMPGGSIGGWG